MDWPEAALRAYCEADPVRKCEQVAQLPQSAYALTRALDLPAQPGRPVSPELIHPARVPRRKLGSVEGRIALIHAVAHIEFNAINLALDAALRFPNMDACFYADWLSVAKDEARHFRMLQDRLITLGSHYGACPAHNGLWEMAEKTAHDPLIRMALVPRVLEARGLDVTPGMIERLRAVGDLETVECLEIILDEEIRHVAIGGHWFSKLCSERSLAVGETFIALLETHLPRRKLATELNELARLKAGFSAEEMAALKGVVKH